MKKEVEKLREKVDGGWEMPLEAARSVTHARENQISDTEHRLMKLLHNAKYEQPDQSS